MSQYRHKNDFQSPLQATNCSIHNFRRFCSFHNFRRFCAFHSFIRIVPWEFRMKCVPFITYFCERPVKQGGRLCQFYSVWSGNNRDPIKSPPVSGGGVASISNPFGSQKDELGAPWRSYECSGIVQWYQDVQNWKFPDQFFDRSWNFPGLTIWFP